MSELHPSSDETLRMAPVRPHHSDFVSKGTSELSGTAARPPLIAPPPGISAISGGSTGVPQWSAPATKPFSVGKAEEPILQQPIQLAPSAAEVFSSSEAPGEVAPKSKIHPLAIYLALIAALAALGFQIWMLFSVE